MLTSKSLSTQLKESWSCSYLWIFFRLSHLLNQGTFHYSSTFLVIKFTWWLWTSSILVGWHVRKWQRRFRACTYCYAIWIFETSTNIHGCAQLQSLWGFVFYKWYDFFPYRYHSMSYENRYLFSRVPLDCVQSHSSRLNGIFLFLKRQ